ncbi:hypothetical protein FB451DRAFT_1363443 [Mycena latifolia]|nr:hypothetical protein FB451DRAFT_1363443 [Mycena latifolia]
MLFSHFEISPIRKGTLLRAAQLRARHRRLFNRFAFEARAFLGFNTRYKGPPRLEQYSESSICPFYIMFNPKLSALLALTLVAIAIAAPATRTTPVVQGAPAANTLDQGYQYAGDIFWDNDRNEVRAADTVDARYAAYQTVEGPGWYTPAADTVDQEHKDIGEFLRSNGRNEVRAADTVDARYAAYQTVEGPGWYTPAADTMIWDYLMKQSIIARAHQFIQNMLWSLDNIFKLLRRGGQYRVWRSREAHRRGVKIELSTNWVIPSSPYRSFFSAPWSSSKNDRRRPPSSATRKFLRRITSGVAYKLPEFAQYGSLLDFLTALWVYPVSCADRLRATDSVNAFMAASRVWRAGHCGEQRGGAEKKRTCIQAVEIATWR